MAACQREIVIKVISAITLERHSLDVAYMLDVERLSDPSEINLQFDLLTEPATFLSG